MGLGSTAVAVRRAGATARLQELLQIVRASTAGQVCCQRGVQATFYLLKPSSRAGSCFALVDAVWMQRTSCICSDRLRVLLILFSHCNSYHFPQDGKARPELVIDGVTLSHVLGAFSSCGRVRQNDLHARGYGLGFRF